MEQTAQTFMDQLAKQNAAAADALRGILERLEKYYPEHKVFALDAIDSTLRDRLSKIYKDCGCDTVEELLRVCGFSTISGDEVKALRSAVLYRPGEEPDIIKGKVESICRRLQEYYPDHVIQAGLEKEHKSLSSDITGVYQWLGYADRSDFLSAYGYTMEAGRSGRPEQKFQPILDALVEKYKTQPKPKNLGALLFENPEYKSALKTLQNRSMELFGISAKQYFQQLGLIGDASAKKETGGKRGRGTTSARAQAVAKELLEETYAHLDPAVYGTWEDAVRKLGDLAIRRHSSGGLMLKRVEECPAEVELPYGITRIAAGAFQGHGALQRISIPGSVEELEEDTFAQCAGLTEVTLEEGLTTIRKHAFSGCTALRKITFPASLRVVEGDAFEGCAALEEVTFQNSWAAVSETAFSGCPYAYQLQEESTDNSLFTYEIAKGRSKGAIITGYLGTEEIVRIPRMLGGSLVVAIDREAFKGNRYLTEVDMPDTVAKIGGGAFQDCISLKKVHLSQGLEKIITSVFKGCIGLEELNIPDQISELKKNTFADCRRLRRLQIGSRLSVIHPEAFARVKYDSATEQYYEYLDVQEITVDPRNTSYYGEGSVLFSADRKTLCLALGKLSAYTVPEGVETIADKAFYRMSTLSDLTLPDSLTRIGASAFYETDLRSVAFGPNLRSIGASAFWNCKRLSGVLFSEGLQEIEDDAFLYCPIPSVVLPSTLRRLGADSFNCLNGYDWERKQTLTIQNNPYLRADGMAIYQLDGEKTLSRFFARGIESYTVEPGTVCIGERAFEHMDDLQTVELPDSLRRIENRAFRSCTGLLELRLPEGLTAIGFEAFMQTRLSDIQIPASVTEVAEGAFAGGDVDSWWYMRQPLNRRIQVAPGNPLLSVEENCLIRRGEEGRSAVVAHFGREDDVHIPNDISELWSYAFCGSLAQTVWIPASVTTIGKDAFLDCERLTRLYIEKPGSGQGSYAVVYFPEAARPQGEELYDPDEEEDEEDMDWSGRVYSDWQIRRQYMDCIRSGADGTLFDFVKYDSLFPAIKTSKDKILIATDRLKSAKDLVPLYREQYLTYLQANAAEAVQVVITYDDLSGLNTLAELGAFTGENIDQSIELAAAARKADVQSFLMDYKNRAIGIQETDYDL